MAIKTLFPSGKKDEPARREDDNPFSLLRREMDTLFDNFFRGFGGEPLTKRFGTFNPNVDVMEGDREVVVCVELPGMDEKDIEVSIMKDALTIKGEKNAERDEKGRDYYRMERSYGSFSRTIPLPSEIDMDRAEAHFKKGVLKVTLPKTARAMKETKKISVKAE
jgi:HSP20 family protein